MWYNILKDVRKSRALKGMTAMKIKWLGHACFLITTEEGKRIITDPYVPGHLDMTYGKIEEEADIVVISHNHKGHNNAAAVKGSPVIIKGLGIKKAGDMEFKGLATFHDTVQGRQRGINTVFHFTVNGIKICHLGDLGQVPSYFFIEEMGKVDLLLVPTGGGSTIGPAEAAQLSKRIKARVVIPMHFRTDKCAYLPSGIEDFIASRPDVKKLDSSEVEFKSDGLPATTEIIVLKHAL
jgi:L-ascorbate metabolism protein UlaG (beta-lactamase superfamily)